MSIEQTMDSVARLLRQAWHFASTAVAAVAVFCAVTGHWLWAYLLLGLAIWIDL